MAQSVANLLQPLQGFIVEHWIEGLALGDKFTSLWIFFPLTAQLVMTHGCQCMNLFLAEVSSFQKVLWVLAHIEQCCYFCNKGGSLAHIIKHLDYCWELAVKKLNYIPSHQKRNITNCSCIVFGFQPHHQWWSITETFFTLSLYKFEACGETADRLDQVVRAGLPGTDSNSRSSGIITEFYKPITFKGDGCQNQFWLLNQSQLIYFTRNSRSIVLGSRLLLHVHTQRSQGCESGPQHTWHYKKD